MTKLCTTVVITPLLLDAIDSAIEAMASYQNNESLNKSAVQDNQVGVVCRAALENNAARRAMLADFVKRTRDVLED